MSAAAETVSRTLSEGFVELAKCASEMKAQWRRGDPPDALRGMHQNPEIARYQSLALDLVYEEYCCRLSAGEELDPVRFSAKFGNLQQSVLRLLATHHCLRSVLADSEHTAVSWPEVGTRFLGYQLLAILGRGAFAQVYLATEDALGGRAVAVKISRQGAVEAHVLGKLCHPNIVPVYSVQRDEATGFVALCMPFVGQSTFADLLDASSELPETGLQLLFRLSQLDGTAEQTQKLPYALIKGRYVDAVVDWGIQLAEALNHTHAEGICHGDIKPSNVLISFDGNPMLLDFNLALSRFEGSRRGGTLAYMAPEQVRALLTQSVRTDHSETSLSDLFALAVVLYQLLAGKHPFADAWVATSHEGPAKLLHIQSRGAEPLCTLAPEVDTKLSELIDACLAFDPAERPHSALEVASKLRESTSPRRHRARWIKRNKSPLRLTCTLAICAMSFAAYLWTLQPSHGMREFSRGMEDYRGANWQSAITHLNNAITANAAVADALYFRGRANLKSGRYLEAFRDFNSLSRMRKDGRDAACSAHCMSMLNYHREAIAWYQQALRNGVETAEIHNNLGYSHYQRKDITAARKHYDVAIELSSRLQAPHCNRAILVLNHKSALPEQLPIAREDVQAALRIGPPSTELHYLAACLYADFHDDQLFFSHLHSAVASGLDKGRLRAEPRFARYLSYPMFRDLLAWKASGSRSSMRLRLDPVSDFH